MSKSSEALEKGDLEKSFHRKNLLIAGVDEVGRGCLAGPVYSAAVILDYDHLFSLDSSTLALIRDSKKLSEKQREKIIPVIEEIALAHAISSSSVQEIDNLNILGATFLAMNRALASLSRRPDITLVDGNKEIKGYKGKQETLIKGDSLAFCIAAASILAKDARDKYMQNISEKFPDYGFESHVGYGTKKHLEALKEHGVLNIHRKTFAPVANLL